MYNIRYGLNYLRHRFVANNRHGIHSPFVYKLIDTVIYDYRPQKVYREIQRILNAQHPDRCVINNLPLKVYELIYRLAVYFKPRTVALTDDESGILSLPIKTAIADAVFLDLLKLADNATADMIIIDAAAHDITQYREKSMPHIHDDTTLMFTNIHRTKKAKQSWTVLKADERVRVTIDLYYLGLVFFKPGMSKEDFRVRY
ncbi:hypothetical protein [Mucilaginibacter celer]|uniref:Uncharacterized protein n=1 Tax=Mucilaginibacter celer TaxID=2305508 RepID=A0A494VXC9_9SPHI|nr:hypothetical protein [Mucilaginibacter celer]AYL98751.1 hypothetical protein HYN43_027305 [Mucilaginibacter celer]